VIDFRYHLVSIIAVFLALAVGLVVGATALSGKALEALQIAQKAARNRIAALENNNASLTNQQKADQAFAQAASPHLLPGLLSGLKVVEVVAPGADNTVTAGVTKALQQAGAQVTGEVIMNSTFLSTDGHDEDTLTQLAQNQAATAGVKPPPQASGPIAGQQAAARVLAASLLSNGGTDPASAESAAILSAFSSAGYVSIGNGATSVSGPASLAVLVAPGGAPPQTGSQVLVALAAALRTAGSGTVMVSGSESVGSNSVIDAEIKAGQVSTVDNADTEIGQILTVQALRLLYDHKPPGQYGIDPDAPNAAPSPAPTPSVTPTATTTTTPSPRTSSGGHR
jgi:Copper transport outer membrane protein, MctB